MHSFAAQDIEAKKKRKVRKKRKKKKKKQGRRWNMNLMGRKRIRIKEITMEEKKE
jgi:hypothetical protein